LVKSRRRQWGNIDCDTPKPTGSVTDPTEEKKRTLRWGVLCTGPLLTVKIVLTKRKRGVRKNKGGSKYESAKNSKGRNESDRKAPRKKRKKRQKGKH